MNESGSGYVDVVMGNAEGGSQELGIWENLKSPNIDLQR